MLSAGPCAKWKRTPCSEVIKNFKTAIAGQRNQERGPPESLAHEAHPDQSAEPCLTVPEMQDHQDTQVLIQTAKTRFGC